MANNEEIDNSNCFSQTGDEILEQLDLEAIEKQFEKSKTFATNPKRASRENELLKAFEVKEGFVQNRGKSSSTPRGARKKKEVRGNKKLDSWLNLRRLKYYVPLPRNPKSNDIPKVVVFREGLSAEAAEKECRFKWFTYENYITDEVTHYAFEHHQQVGIHESVDLFLAIAKGLHVVHSDWLKTCKHTGELEDEFEYTRDKYPSKDPGKLFWRPVVGIQLQVKNLFKDYLFIFPMGHGIVNFAFSATQLMDLVRAAGGTVRDTLDLTAQEDQGYKAVYVVTSRLLLKRREMYLHYVNRRWLIVYPEFILYCLWCGSIPEEVPTHWLFTLEIFLKTDNNGN